MADTETVIQDNNSTVAEPTQERTFTQAELDEIVKSRVAKERAKFTDYDSLREKATKFDELQEANKSELQKATERAEALQKQIDSMTHENEIRGIRDKVANETGVPANLLLGNTEEECTEQANKILAFKNENASYPVVKDGGEVQNLTPKKTAQDQFADWLNASFNS